VFKQVPLSSADFQPAEFTIASYEMAFIFPYPENSDSPPILVPYIASSTYDLDVPDAFTQFAKQQGFTSPAHPELDITRDPLELSSLMQSWLYSGLIGEVTDQPIDHTKFLLHHGDSEHEAPCIDVRINVGLDTLLKNCRSAEDVLEKTFQKARKHHIHKCLLFARQMCNSFEKSPPPQIQHLLLFVFQYVCF
jgi:hypothetical protein